MKMIKLKKFAFKIDAPFRSCITKVNSTLIYISKDCNIAMPMCNILEYIQNYSVKSGSLWNYYRDERPDINDNVSDGKSLNVRQK